MPITTMTPMLMLLSFDRSVDTGGIRHINIAPLSELGFRFISSENRVPAGLDLAGNFLSEVVKRAHSYNTSCCCSNATLGGFRAKHTIRFFGLSRTEDSAACQIRNVTC